MPAPSTCCVISPRPAVTRREKKLHGEIVASNKKAATMPSVVSNLETEFRRSFVFRQARRVLILLVGGTVLIAGIALIVLPGPAIIVIPAGLSILAIEFAWARRWLRRARKIWADSRNRLSR
jgi:hypothetical protein